MSLKRIVRSALNAAVTYGQSVEELRKLFARKSETAVRAALLPEVAEFYGVELVEGQKKAAGTLVLDKEAAGYEAAKKALQRLVRDVMGKTAAKSEEVEIPAELIAAAEKLAKLASQYEGARSLASKALAHAFAK